ncbi:benzoate 4-monooxygenase cytochrome P450 [Xylaria telfairii]|nr:benzoate 4-monooxygenase cytochrome P450 [Xylaria telfairii]
MSAPSLVASAVGILVHRCLFIHGEWHLQGPAIASAHLILFAILLPISYHYCYYYSSSNNPYILHGSIVASYLCSLLASIATYRLYFHPLKLFPGPRLVALSKLWHVWKCRDSRDYQILESWHRQYGTIVRTGPNELTLFHPAAHEAMDGPKNSNTRSDLYDLLHPLVSSIFTRDCEIHDDRRKLWDKALSLSAASQYHARLINQVHLLETIVSETVAQPIDMNELIHWYAFDSMGDFGFGFDFGMMKNRKWADGALYLRSAMTLLGPFSPAIWLAKLAFTFVPGKWKVSHWFKMLKVSDACMNARMERESDEPDIISSFITEYKQTERTEFSRQLLGGDAATLFVAGSDTTASSLIILFYFLALYPNHVAKIQKELDAIDYTDIKSLTALPHLDGTINESMRLLPSVPSWGSRVVSPEGLTLDGLFIPGGTKICAPRYSLGRLESAYARPEEFIPERWYSQPELIKDRRAFSPFGVGRRSCAGKRFAMIQLKLVAASLLKKYDLAFLPGSDSKEAFERDFRDQLTANPGKLMLVFQKRRD